MANKWKIEYRILEWDDHAGHLMHVTNRNISWSTTEHPFKHRSFESVEDARKAVEEYNSGKYNNTISDLAVIPFVVVDWAADVEKP